MAGPGVVQRLRAAFERLIRSHQSEPDSVLIDRALRNSNEMVAQGISYTERLQVAEHFSLANLLDNLLEFVRDHENLQRATRRSGQDALAAMNSPDADVFTRVAARILHLRLVHHLQIIQSTSGPISHIQISQDPAERELRECTALLIDEIFRILLRLEVVMPDMQSSSSSSDELENIGPDHNIADFGTELVLRPIYIPDPKLKLRHQSHKGYIQEKEIDLNDPMYRCAICLDSYHPTRHPAFQIAKCGHIVGKPCLATWLNGTSQNANRCPYCRAVLCERRARRPKPNQPVLSTTSAAELSELTDRLTRALNLLEDVDRLVYEIFGEEEGEEGLWTDHAILELNERLFEEGVEFGFARDGFEEVGWRIRSVDWAAMEEV